LHGVPLDQQSSEFGFRRNSCRTVSNHRLMLLASANPIGAKTRVNRHPILYKPQTVLTQQNLF
jgi:hypothetical protein